MIAKRRFIWKSYHYGNIVRVIEISVCKTICKNPKKLVIGENLISCLSLRQSENEYEKKNFFSLKINRL